MAFNFSYDYTDMMNYTEPFTISEGRFSTGRTSGQFKDNTFGVVIRSSWRERFLEILLSFVSFWQMRRCET